MSTIKADAVTALSAGGDLSLDGLGTGGVSIASTLKMTKGGDISSASPLVIDTDGNYFDVTGTTNFSAMTVEAGNFFMLQFDGALTITHGSGIELPGAANLTTATGDRLICYATAADTVEVMSVETEAASAGGGAWAFVETVTSSNAATTNFETLDAGSARFMIIFHDYNPATDTTNLWMRIGTGGTPTYQAGALDYAWGADVMSVDGSDSKTTDDPDTEMVLNGETLSIGNAADECAFGVIHFGNPHSTTYPTMFTWNMTYVGNPNYVRLCQGGGMYDPTTAVTAVQLLSSSGNHDVVASLYKSEDS